MAGKKDEKGGEYRVMRRSCMCCDPVLLNKTASKDEAVAYAEAYDASTDHPGPEISVIAPDGERVW